MAAGRPVVPVILSIIGFIGAARFLPNVRTVDAIGLFACGALVGVSLMRLLAMRRRG